ncbi:MAG: pantoate--beta-alanine ligase [Cystobacterineae bacterium]|nr:pantoate--beta-alanine ligase [Cystobacterineae bacterium]
MSLLFLRRAADIRSQVVALAAQGRRLALVPTMGCLHEGHLALVEAARAKAEVVALSIFVNPLQFGPQEDFSRYPRQLEEDFRLCEKAGVDWLYAPEEEQLYPPGFQTYVSCEALSQPLCGQSRPMHFRGVATVVCKLFALFRPCWAMFGEKDFQQLCLVRAMSRDLDLGVEVVGIPIVRAEDGLALSSRNVLLSAAEREQATALFRVLLCARQRYGEGERLASVLLEEARQHLFQAGIRVDYIDIVDEATLQPIEYIEAQGARMLVAGFVGSTRLIDNMALEGA